MSHIFISYSHKDKAYVHKLQQALIDEGFDAWIDDRISYGDEWLKVIQKQLDACDAFIIVMSQNAYESDMVQNECTRAREKKKKIFPVLLEGEHWLVFQAKQFIDVRDGSLPTEKFYRLLEVVTPRNKHHAELPPPLPPEPVRWRPSRKLIGFSGIIVGIVAVSWWAIQNSPIPVVTITPSLTSTERPGATFTASVPPATASFTPSPTAIGTKTLTSTPLPTELTDDKGVLMRLVPAGEFTMGSTAENGYGFCLNMTTNIVNYGRVCKMSNYQPEEPTHKVYLDDYFVDVFEVSNGEYKKCVASGACLPPSSNNANLYSSYYDNDFLLDYPVLNVTWEMAGKYCEWRSARLPTEAEWEKAARGIDEREFPWGYSGNGYIFETVFYSNRANVNLNPGGSKATVPVSSNSKGLSPYGLYNMAGNVAEWVYDWYGETYYSASAYENPTGPASGNYKVVRGGSVNDFDARTVARAFLGPTGFNTGVGFRCARDAGP